MRAIPSPWRMPPWIWPSTSVGLIARPTSWAATTAPHLHRPELDVHVDLGDLGPEGVCLVRDALAVGVERRGLRVVRAVPEQHAAPGPLGQLAQLDDRRRVAIPRDHPAVPEFERRVRPRLGHREQLAAQVVGGQPRRVPRHERLARRRGLARVEAEVGVGPDPLDQGHRDAEGVGGDLGEDRVRALPDVGRAREQHDVPVGPDADLDLRGVGQRRVADAVPHGRDPDAAAERAGRPLVVPRGVGAHRRPAGAKRLQAGGQARAGGQPLGVAVRSPARSALRSRNSRGSMSSWPARSSISASWAMATCGTPNPRKAPAGVPLV